MCQGRVDFESVELSHLIDFKRHFAQELERLEEPQRQGLVEVGPTSVELTPTGWYFTSGRWPWSSTSHCSRTGPGSDTRASFEVDAQRRRGHAIEQFVDCGRAADGSGQQPALRADVQRAVRDHHAQLQHRAGAAAGR